MKKGSLQYCVLAVIASRRRYGYEIVRVLSENGLITYEGTIYPLLARLKRDGLVTAYWQESEKGAPRKYYEITAQGREELRQFKKAWADYRRAVSRILEGDEARDENPGSDN